MRISIVNSAYVKDNMFNRVDPMIMLVINYPTRMRKG